ncbi:MAG TPA: ABC-F family ATP-binding cassette domain-containing protein [Chloroflexota bacterium]|nr:ABC-F family ATP-binding cassette domain-containing protein [Chloroflexota bacterium]
MLTVEHVGLTLGDRAILDDISFQIAPGEKVGLVGVNGAGKSSLLKILAGQLLSDQGQVSVPSSVGYLSQEPRAAYHPDQTVLECLLEARGLLRLSRELETTARAMGQARQGSPELTRLLASYGDLQHEWERLGGYEGESLARRLLDGLGLSRVQLGQPFSVLSGGQKTRLALAALLFIRPDLLLLDEPTNHLDRTAAGWLMDFLVAFPGTVLVVSHDLLLLDRAISRVLRIDEQTGQLDVYRGNYSKYVAQREERRAQAEKQASLVGRKVAQLQETVDRWRSKPTRATQAKNMERRIARLRESAPEIQAQSRVLKIKGVEAAPTGRVVLEVSDLWKAYGANIVLTGVTFAQERGQTLALLGPNGAGKTTLLRIIAGVLAADDGRVRPGHNVRIGYYAQEHEALDSAATVFEEARRSALSVVPSVPLSDGQVRSFLGTFLFGGARVHQRIETLSGGERTRLALAKLFLEKANLLLLDEPTNNLDPASQEALLKALKGFTGSVVVVCHVVDFMQRLAPERALVLPSNEFGPFDPALLAREEPTRKRANGKAAQPAGQLALTGARPDGRRSRR